LLSAAYLGNHEIGIVETQPEPPGPGQVQVQVAYAGICGSDLHVLHGDMDGP
jgi:(R,R)-butanediol dehydrogenase/meso-butanediol dehydrogenase/diacetyl reductase